MRSAPPRTPLARALARHLARAPDLLPAGARILVATSGGLDSVALLHLLCFTTGGRELFAAHFDHRMRPDSGGDRTYTRGLARAWNIPFLEGRAVGPLDREADARAARYAFLEEAADRVGADRIVTAHHADDQVETVLFRLLRGTDLPGLGGIPARRGRIVRPLLPFRRRRIARYARAVGLAWREDPSNVSLQHARNRLRHRILPALEAAAPGTGRALLHLGRTVTHAEDRLRPLLDAVARQVITPVPDGGLALARDTLLAYDAEVCARVLRRAVQRIGGTPGGAGLATAGRFLERAGSGVALELAGGLRLEREFGRFVLFRPGAVPADRPLVLTPEGEGSGQAVIGNRRVPVTWGDRPGAGGHSLALDPEALRLPLTLRAWRPGDRIRLGFGTKKLKKLFAERRLARAARTRVPVLADATGRILWAVGVAAAADAGPRPGHSTLYITVWE